MRNLKLTHISLLLLLMAVSMTAGAVNYGHMYVSPKMSLHTASTTSMAGLASAPVANAPVATIGSVSSTPVGRVKSVSSGTYNYTAQQATSSTGSVVSTGSTSSHRTYASTLTAIGSSAPANLVVNGGSTTTPVNYGTTGTVTLTSGDFDGYGDGELPPVGDAILPLLALCFGYAAFRFIRKKKRAQVVND